MFANPWGFIISLLPQALNFLYLLLLELTPPRSSFLILPTQLKCHSKRPEMTIHITIPLPSQLSLWISPYLIFFRTCCCLKLSCILICLLFDHHFSLPLNWAKSSGLQRAWLSCWGLIISPGAVAGTQHASYKDFLEEKKEDSFFSSWGPIPEWKTWARSVVLKVNQQDHVSWELVRNSDSQVQFIPTMSETWGGPPSSVV